MIPPLQRLACGGALVLLIAIGAALPLGLAVTRAASAPAGAGETARELRFTFHSPHAPWTTDETRVLSEAIAAFYPLARAIYGPPAFSLTINLRRDPTAPRVYYDPFLNEIVLAGVEDLTSLCHEMLHAFRDDFVIGLDGFEEGMVRAAEVEIFDRLERYDHWDEDHAYTYDVYFEALQTAALGAPDGQYDFGAPNFTLLRYQLAGYAWAKVFLEDDQFLVRFNRALTHRAAIDPSILTDEAALVALAAELRPRVEGRPFAEWYRSRGVFRIDSAPGYRLYQRINQFTIDLIRRDASGLEQPMADAVVDWAVYDHADRLLASGTGVTGPGGFLFIDPELPSGYTGRLAVAARHVTPDGAELLDVAFRKAGNDTGLFGVVLPAASGRLTITPLDHGDSVTVPVTAGAFAAPTLQGRRGRFAATLRDSDGRYFRREFTKDAGDYFLLLDASD